MVLCTCSIHGENVHNRTAVLGFNGDGEVIFWLLNALADESGSESASAGIEAVFATGVFVSRGHRSMG